MVLRGGPRGRVGRRRTYLKRVAPDEVERPSSFVWILLGGCWRLVGVAEGRGAPKGRGAGGPRTGGGRPRGASAAGGAPRTSRATSPRSTSGGRAGARTPGRGSGTGGTGSAGSGRGRPVPGREDQEPRASRGGSTGYK